MAAASIHLSPPDMSARERQALLDAFESNWIAPVGPALSEFEARLSSIAGTEAAVATVSGTSALHLALRVLDIGPGDIVIVPSVTFVASANVVRYVGAEPHFVGCDLQTGNIDPGFLEQAIEDLSHRGLRPAAIMTVDLYGACADYTKIERIASRFGIPIIEDAAEAIGATHNRRPAGSFGTLAAFSFNGNKLATTGGGGALVGPSQLVDRARYLACQARDAEVHFQHSELGYAYRMPNLSAALGCAQLERLDLLVSRTRAVHTRYLEALGDLDGVSVIDQDHDGRGNGWLTVVQLDQRVHPTPAAICQSLAERAIEARPAWKPMHLQPLYADSGCTGAQNARTHFEQGLCLPSGSTLTERQQERVVASFIEALASARPIVLDAVDLRIERIQKTLSEVS